MFMIIVEREKPSWTKPSVLMPDANIRYLDKDAQKIRNFDYHINPLFKMKYFKGGFTEKIMCFFSSENDTF